MSFDTAQAEVIKRGLTGVFDITARNTNVFYPTICTVINSRRADENYGFLGSVNGVREWLGNRIFNQLRAGEYRIANKAWESSLEIDRFNLEDDYLDLYRPVVADLGAEAALHPDELVFDAILAGETDLCFDGKAFFATDHEWGDSGAQSNLKTFTPAAGAGNDIVAADIKNAFNEARNAMARYKNDQGKLFNRTTIQRQADLAMLIPPELEQQTRDALETKVYTLVSGIGGENKVLDQPQIYASPYLTNQRQVYLLHLGRAMKPFVFQARQPLRRAVTGLQANEIEFRNVKMMTEARYNVGYGTWFTCVKTTFS